MNQKTPQLYPYLGASLVFLSLALPLVTHLPTGHSAALWYFKALPLHHYLGSNPIWGYGFNLLLTLLSGWLVLSILSTHKPAYGKNRPLVFWVLLFFYLCPIHLPGYLSLSIYPFVSVLLLLSYRLYLKAIRRPTVWIILLIGLCTALGLCLSWHTTLPLLIAWSIAPLINRDKRIFLTSFGTTVLSLTIWVVAYNYSPNLLQLKPIHPPHLNLILHLINWISAPSLGLWVFTFSVSLRKGPAVRSSFALWIPVLYLLIGFLFYGLHSTQALSQPADLTSLVGFGAVLVGLALSNYSIQLNLTDGFVFLGVLGLSFLTLDDSLHDLSWMMYFSEWLPWLKESTLILAVFSLSGFILTTYWQYSHRKLSPIFAGLCLSVVINISALPHWIATSYPLADHFGLPGGERALNYARRELETHPDLRFPGYGARLPSQQHGICNPKLDSKVLILASPLLSAGAYCFSYDHISHHYQIEKQFGVYQVWHLPPTK